MFNRHLLFTAIFFIFLPCGVKDYNADTVNVKLWGIVNFLPEVFLYG